MVELELQTNELPYLAITHEVQGMSEQHLLEQLSGQRGMRALLPDGASYQEEVQETNMDLSGPVLSYWAHPGDRFDFAQMLADVRGKIREVHEHIFTDGALGINGLSPDEARPIRQQEAKMSADFAGVLLRHNTYPDASLGDYIVSASQEVASEISDRQPSVIVIHGFENDHPDHKAAALVVLRGLAILHRQDAFKKDLRPPSLYISDPEGGVMQERFWQPNISTLEWSTEHPLVIPQLIVDVPIDKKMKDFYVNNPSQAFENPPVSNNGSGLYYRGDFKPYVRNIPMRARLLGRQIEHPGETKWGEGFRQLVIPGVTSSENRLVGMLPQGKVHRLQQAA